MTAVASAERVGGGADGVARSSPPDRGGMMGGRHGCGLSSTTHWNDDEDEGGDIFPPTWVET